MQYFHTLLAAWLLLSPQLGLSSLAAEESISNHDLTAISTTLQKHLRTSSPLTRQGVHIAYPFENTVFPPEMVPPKVEWTGSLTPANSWLVAFTCDGEVLSLAYPLSDPQWTPPPGAWEIIKKKSVQRPVTMVVLEIDPNQDQVVSGDQVSFRTSRDEVGAAILFREVPLPFIEAVRNPSQIRWRLGKLDDSEGPRTLWQGSPVCANCHSFSQDGRSMAMDIDYPTKGSQVISEVGTTVAFKSDDLIQWENASQPPGARTFGLLSQISPDGDWMVSTVHDDYLMWGEGFAFSQFFLPVRGVLAVYHRPTRQFHLLKGADNPDYVQTNPVWSPDGRSIVFARASALPARDIVRGIIPDGQRVLPILERRGGFRFDLYQIPFNDGQGGVAEPLTGGSQNKRSNYFPKFSPDGRWIVFCQSSNYMFLQPDSELFIVPAQGGTARRLAANTSLMNSWHSWSPNSRWLVFSSKASSPFTQLFLTYIDPAGESAAPVRLDQWSSPDRAANLPEFINGPCPDRFDLQFAQDESRVCEGNELFASGRSDQAMQAYRQALDINPSNVEARQKLGLLLWHIKADTNAALAELNQASRLAPKNAYIHHNLGWLHFHSGELDLALSHLREAHRGMTNLQDNPYNPYDNRYKWGFFWRPGNSRSDLVRSAFLVHMDLVEVLFAKGQYGECIDHLALLTQRNGRNFSRAHYLLARAYAATGQLGLSRQSLAKARQLSPSLNPDPLLLTLLSKSAL